MTKQLSEVETNTTTAVRRYGQSIEKYLGYLGPCILSKLDFISRLGIDLKNSASQMLTMMFTVSGDLNMIRAVILRLDRGIDSGEHFVLEDATGRSFPVHFKTITSWESFDFILTDRFKGKKGEHRTRRKRYSLHESASHHEIDRSVNFEDAFAPYQKIDMSLICKSPEALTTDGDTGLSSCPWCQAVSPGRPGTRVQCVTCKRVFTRAVIEADDEHALFPPPAPTPKRIFDVQFGKPSFWVTGKRARENEDENEACAKCRQPKRSKGGHLDKRTQKTLQPEADADSESDEENVSGLTHITLRTTKTRLSATGSKPFQATQANSFDLIARQFLGGDPHVLTAISIGELGDQNMRSYDGDAGRSRVTELLSDDSEDSGNKERLPYHVAKEEGDVADMENGSESPLAHDRSQPPSPTDPFQGKYSPTEYLGSPRREFDGTYATSGQCSPRYNPNGEYATASGHYYSQPANSRSRSASSSTPRTGGDLTPQVPPKHEKEVNLEETQDSQPRIATEADAKRHRIPAGYSLKDWDPTERPIIFLGSVFDVDSLGKWICEWTVHHHGQETPISDMAGEMWLLLTKLAGQIKRAENAMPNIRSRDNVEIVKEFIKSGEALMNIRLRRLLKACEKRMLESVSKRNLQLEALSLWKQCSVLRGS